MTFITHGFLVSVVSDVRERVRDFRITFIAEHLDKLLQKLVFADKCDCVALKRTCSLCSVNPIFSKWLSKVVMVNTGLLYVCFWINISWCHIHECMCTEINNRIPHFIIVPCHISVLWRSWVL